MATAKKKLLASKYAVEKFTFDENVTKPFKASFERKLDRGSISFANMPSKIEESGTWKASDKRMRLSESFVTASFKK